jgi:plasmid stabilization system protein ParE
VADSVIARLIEAIYRAADRPLLYQQRRELRASPRRLNVFRYAIFFEALPEGDGIFVWRVLHGARDLRRVLRRPRFPEE